MKLKQRTSTNLLADIVKRHDLVQIPFRETVIRYVQLLHPLVPFLLHVCVEVVLAEVEGVNLGAGRGRVNGEPTCFRGERNDAGCGRYRKVTIGRGLGFQGHLGDVVTAHLVGTNEEQRAHEVVGTGAPNTGTCNGLQGDECQSNTGGFVSDIISSSTRQQQQHKADHLLRYTALNRRWQSDNGSSLAGA